MSKKLDAGFPATYFDRDTVLRIARYAVIAAWVVVAVYAFDLVLAAGVYTLQLARGLFGTAGVTDVLTNVVYIVERPFRGVVYFFALQAVAKGLLILLDVEDNTRRGARKS